MIDAHVHVWRLGRNGCAWPTPDLVPIYRDFTIEDLRAVTAAAGVDRVLLVQSQEDANDTRWLLSLAGDPLVAAVVGWADFEHPDASDAISALALQPTLRALRPMVQDRDSNWYDSLALDPAFDAMAEAGVVLDGLVRPRHLPSLTRLAERHPGLRIVIDHGAKPNFRDFGAWAEQIEAIAGRENVSCKFSGLLTELPSGAPPSAMEPAFRILWNAFGAGRLLWGSDWPVLTLAGTYEGWLEQALALVPAEHHERVFDSNARRLYGIGP